MSVSDLHFFHVNLEPGSRAALFLQNLSGNGAQGSELEGANMDSGGKEAGILSLPILLLYGHLTCVLNTECLSVCVEI